MGLRLSGSQIQQAMSCAYAFRPDVVIGHADLSGRAARTGTLFASMREVHVSGGGQVARVPGADEARAARLMARWVPWWEDFRRDYPGYRWATEVPYAYDWRNGEARVLARGEHREYVGSKPSDVVGTADVVGVGSDDDRVIVLDDKTGRRENVHQASGNAQLAFLATAACRAHGKKRAMVGLVFPGEDPVGTDWRAMAMADLVDFDQALGLLMMELPAARPRVTDDCWKCVLKQFGGCPEYDALDAMFPGWSPRRRRARRAAFLRA